MSMHIYVKRVHLIILGKVVDGECIKNMEINMLENYQEIVKEELIIFIKKN